MKINRIDTVAHTIFQDWKRQGITYEEAAKKLGYKTRQSLYNLFSKTEYLGPEQAKRFKDAFGYNINFLMYGIGPLRGDTLGWITDYENYEENVKSCLLHIAKVIIITTGDIDANSAWAAINEGDLTTFKSAMEKLADNHNPNMKRLIPDSMAEYVANSTATTHK